MDYWFALVAISTIVYVPFVVRRREAGLGWTLVLAMLMGPLVWFVWLARRAGVRRARDSERR